jgi:hypothetical protein
VAITRGAARRGAGVDRRGVGAYAVIIRTDRKGDVMFCSREDRGSAILISLVVGGMVGAAVALLLAPQSGKRTRQQIGEFADDLSDTVGGFAKKAKDKLA